LSEEQLASYKKMVPLKRFGKPEEVLSYQMLEDAYGCRLLLDENPLGKYPRVTLVPGKHLDTVSKPQNPV